MRLNTLPFLSAACVAGLIAVCGASEPSGTAPRARGVVLRVTRGECVVSLGTDDGLSPGRILHLADPARAARLKVIRAEPTTAVASLLSTGGEQSVVVGDTISTSPIAAVAPTRVSHPPDQEPADGRRAGTVSAVSAVVVRVQGDQLELSRGEAQGVRRGMLGSVARGGTEAVAVVVTAATQHSATARVLGEQADNAEPTVTVGDTVECTAAPEGEKSSGMREVNQRDFEQHAMERFWPASGAQGSSGLINVPVAETAGDGKVTVGYTQTQGYNTVTRSEGKLGVHYLNVGFLPRLEITGRFTKRDILPGDREFDKLDRSANVKVQALTEGARQPAVALGMDDVAGNQITRAAYVVGTKQFGTARLHLGYGRERLGGVFGGAEVRVTPQASLMTEWDTDQINSGLRWRLTDRLNVDAHFLGMEHLRFGLNYTASLGSRDEPDWPGGGDEYVRPTAESGDFGSVVRAIAGALTAADFEDVTVEVRDSLRERFPGLTVFVAYADRSRPRTPLAGLSEALYHAIMDSPANVRNVCLTVKSRDVPVTCLTTRTDDYLKFLNRQVSADMYGSRIEVAVAPRGGAETLSGGAALLGSLTSAANPSYLRTDVSVRPRLEYDLGSPADYVRTRGLLTAESVTLLDRGTTGELQLGQTVWNEFNRLADRDRLHLNRALLRQVRRVGDSTFLQGAVGYLGTETYGASGEVLHVLSDDRLTLGLHGNALGESLGDLGHKSVLTDFRYRVPNLDLTASVKYGRFLGGDRGTELALDRWFGHHRLGLVGATTDYGSYGGIRFSFPMGPSRYGTPDATRVHWSDEADWSYQSNPGGDRGRKLNAGGDLEKTAMQGERLYPSYVLQHLERLRNVAPPTPKPLPASP